MKLNKQAIMVKALVSILLAIIIFVPVILGITKYCQYSAQAGNNFIEFVNDIKRMEDWEKGVTKVILDEGTAFVYFESEKEEVKVKVDGKDCDPVASPGAEDYEVVFKKPPSCREGSCLCLFREVEIDDKVIRSMGICEPVMNLKLNDCGVGAPLDANSYTCESGFVIERLLIAKTWSSAYCDVYYEAPRRIPLQMKKEGDTVYLESQ